jgi:hypothetical protein
MRIASASLVSTSASRSRVCSSRTGLASLVTRELSSSDRASMRSASATCSSVSRPPRSATSAPVSVPGVRSARGLSRTLSFACRSASSTRSISPRSALALVSQSAMWSWSGMPLPDLSARSPAIPSSSPASRPASSPTASRAGCTRSGAKTSPPASPARVPTSVSVIRPVATVSWPAEAKISIALIGTSSRSSPSRSKAPMTSVAAISSPSSHQLKPTNAETATAARTPAVTLTTLRIALRMVWNRLACSTSSAVSGASTGRDVPKGTSSASR